MKNTFLTLLVVLCLQVKSFAQIQLAQLDSLLNSLNARELALGTVSISNGINYPRIDILEGIIKSCFNEQIEVPFTGNYSINLEQYPDVYEAAQMPVVTISTQNEKLVAETQDAKFELEPVMKDYFMHTPTGYYFQFNPAENSLQIKETDNVYFLKKK